MSRKRLRNVTIVHSRLEGTTIDGTLITDPTGISGVTASSDELNIMDGATLSTAELNILDGVTATAAELNLIDGSVAGTAVASKAATLGSNKELDEFHTAALYLGAAAGTLISATAAEINKLAGVTAGTSAASKAAVLGTNKDLDILALPVSGLKIGAGAGTAVDTTAAELNTLNSVTAGTVAASKAVVVDANKVALGIRQPVVVVTADTTLTEADSGKIIIINAAASKVLTLPATAAGLTFTLQHQVATSSGAGHAFSPAAADLIRGNGFTPADNKDAICSQATSRIGDSMTIVGDGVDGWYITSVTGTWARE